MDVFGIYLDADLIKVARLKKNKKGLIDISDLRSSKCIEEDSDVKPLYLLDSMADARSRCIVSGLEGSRTFLRNIEVKLQSSRKILKTLPFLTEEMTPFPQDETILLPQIAKKNADTCSVRLIASKTSWIENHIHELAKYDIEPEILSCYPAALCRFHQYFFSENTNSIVIHIGFEESLVVSLAEGCFNFSYAFPTGIKHLLQAASLDLPHLSKEQRAEKMNTLDLSRLNPDLCPNLHNEITHLEKEIDRTLSHMESKEKILSSCPVFLCGNFSSLIYLKNHLESKICKERPVVVLQDHPKFDILTILCFAIPIGLALDGMCADKRSVQFRQKSFISSTAMQRRIRSLTIFVGSCLLLSLGLTLLGNRLLQQKEELLTSKLEAPFTQLGLEMPEEKLDVLQKVHILEQAYSKNKKPFAYSSPLPTVSDVLAWISTHPKLSSYQEKEGKDVFIEMEKVKYQMVKYPHVGAENQSYQVQVELAFRCTSPQAARAFHSALQEDSLIDDKKQISWKNQESFYQASFFLKPQLEARK